jgi:hypothetical protein
MKLEDLIKFSAKSSDPSTPCIQITAFHKYHLLFLVVKQTFLFRIWLNHRINNLPPQE